MKVGLRVDGVLNSGGILILSSATEEKLREPRAISKTKYFDLESRKG